VQRPFIHIRKQSEKRPKNVLARFLTVALLVPAILTAWALAHGQEGGPAVSPKDLARYQAYKSVVDKTAGMVGDASVQQLASKHGLQVLNLTWEDTARFQNSAVGPNISDMTIQMQQRNPRTGKYTLTCMPVIRFPNFTDKTADIDANNFYLLVGNETGKDLRRVSLMDYLANVRRYLNKPGSWKGDRTYLHANRDTHVLVSAQACFLPIPKDGSAEFNPVLFNYQSMKGDPAVLTILVTREGTSATIIDNQRDAFQGKGVWGQRLFFNLNGQRASLSGQRLSDFTAGGQVDPNGPKVDAAGQKGLNMVLVIQVPLKQKNPMCFPAPGGGGVLPEAAPGGFIKPKLLRSDVEDAVIGHGKVEGPFTEIDNLDIERDERYPVRVTVQFYKATSNGVVSEKDMAEIAEQIQKVYKQGDYVGSLVVDGRTGRPTDYEGSKVQPPDWWRQFWKRHLQNTGQTREQAIQQLRKLHGQNWVPLTERELANEIEQLNVPGQEDVSNQALDGQTPLLAGLGGAGCLAGTFLVLRLRQRGRMN
jgi:hypothetical protein